MLPCGIEEKECPEYWAETEPGMGASCVQRTPACLLLCAPLGVSLERHLSWLSVWSCGHLGQVLNTLPVSPSEYRCQHCCLKV